MKSAVQKLLDEVKSLPVADVLRLAADMLDHDEVDFALVLIQRAAKEVARRSAS